MLLQRQVKTTLQEVVDGTCDGALAMIVDLDGFKEVNDTLGHQQGDVLLVEVAARFVRAAGPDALVARLGGDEFAVLMRGACSEADAVAAGQRLLSALAEPILLDGVLVDVGASVGVALAPLHASDSSSLLKRADIAMYAAKVSGRGVTVFQSTLDSTDPSKLALVGEFVPPSPPRAAGLRPAQGRTARRPGGGGGGAGPLEPRASRHGVSGRADSRRRAQWPHRCADVRRAPIVRGRLCLLARRRP